MELGDLKASTQIHLETLWPLNMVSVIMVLNLGDNKCKLVVQNIVQSTLQIEGSCIQLLESFAVPLDDGALGFGGGTGWFLW